MNQTNSNNESNVHVNNVSDEDDDGDPPQTFNEHPNFEQKTQTSTKPIIRNNKAIKKEGVRYFCNQCDYQAGYQSDLTRHIQSKHEGVKYACNQCGYQATRQSRLTIHIQYKHEGVKYACNQCDYQGSRDALRHHLKIKHL